MGEYVVEITAKCIIWHKGINLVFWPGDLWVEFLPIVTQGSFASGILSDRPNLRRGLFWGTPSTVFSQKIWSSYQYS